MAVVVMTGAKQEVRPLAHWLCGVSVAFLLRGSCVAFLLRGGCVAFSLHTRNTSDAALLLLLLALSGHMDVSH